MRQIRKKALNAIDIAKGVASRTDGLRAIRRFEMINEISFDPRNPTHLSQVRGCGEDERFFRKAKKILADTRRLGR